MGVGIKRGLITVVCFMYAHFVFSELYEARVSGSFMKPELVTHFIGFMCVFEFMKPELVTHFIGFVCVFEFMKSELDLWLALKRVNLNIGSLLYFHAFYTLCVREREK